MLAIKVLVKPCRARSYLSSEALLTIIWLVSLSIESLSENLVANSPLGPLTFTKEPFISTSTPEGISTGLLPILDICTLSLLVKSKLVKSQYLVTRRSRELRRQPFLLWLFY